MNTAQRPASIDSLATTTRLLVRSGIEIARTLEAMLADGDPVTAEVLQGERLFLSRLLQVDAQARTFLVACAEARDVNIALLGAPAATFTCNHRGAHYGFVAKGPREAEHAGTPGLRFDFPLALFAHQRREHPRISLPPRVPLRCEIEWGPLSFDALVVDVSLDGIGIIVHDPGIRLQSGARLERTRIMHPERDPVFVDLEVRYSYSGVGNDGAPATRSGCRILGAPGDLKDLIRLFVTDLDAKP